ncbi:MAG: DNA primase [Bacillota bacterium]
MSQLYNEDFIEKIRFSNDIIDVVSEYTSLKQSGKSHKGLCPFHDEQTASFNVSADQQLYYCFGCGVGGNIFNFIMEIEGLTFTEAIEFLADRANIDLPEENNSQARKRKVSERKKLLQIHKLATQFYNYLLLESDFGQEAYDYLLGRGFDEDVIEKFQLGFAPDRWQGLYKFLSDKGYSDQVLAKSGLVLPRKNTDGYYDRFRNRVMFTIFDHRHQAIGFGGRVLSSEQQPKYLNSPQTQLFDKSQNLYGLNWAKESMRKTGEAIITEGYTDVITAAQHGIENVIASLGTALTSQQAKLLNRYVDRVYIAYDSDIAGAKATLRGLDVLKEAGLEVKVISLGVDQDPDEYIKELGKSEFMKTKENSTSLIQFKIDQTVNQKKLANVDDRVNAVQNLLPIIDSIEDQVEKDEYIKKIAEKLQIRIEVLRAELKKYKKTKHQDRKVSSRNNNNDSRENMVFDDSKKNGYQNAVHGLFKIILNNSHLIDFCGERLTSDDFAAERHSRLFAVICELYQAEGEVEINKLFKKIEDESVEKMLTKLAVEENDLNYVANQDEILEDYINKIKGYQSGMKKEDLEAKIKLAEQENNHQELNQLLMKYQNLLRKEEQ